MKEAQDFIDECDSIAALIDAQEPLNFDMVTQFKDWTIGDIIKHLHLWNIGADLTLNQPDEFKTLMMKLMGDLMSGKSHHQMQNEYFDGQSHADIYAAWKAEYPDIAARFSAANPNDRVPWAGPDMTVRNCIIARQMEHWAHAQAIFDVLGMTRINADRLKNIAHIGVTTYSWSFKVNAQKPPAPKPYVRLKAPSGAIWEWNDPQDDNRVDGSAQSFCQIVTQCRNAADTDIKTVGDIAARWMSFAQCFAGGAEKQPEKGSRFRKSRP